MNRSLPPRFLKWIAIGLPTLVLLGIVWNIVRETPEEAIERLGGRVTKSYRGPEWVPSLLNYVPSGARFLDKLSLVTSVDASGTEFGDEDAPQLLLLDGLGTLALGETRITDSGLEAIGKLKNLRSLSLGNTAITDSGLARLQGCWQLSQINLESTRVTGLGLRHIGGLSELRSVSLADTRVCGSGLSFLAALPNLQQLNLSGTPIADDDLEHLRGLSAVTLSLRDTQITESGLSWLNRANRIVGLDLAGTQVTDRVFRHLLTYPQLGRVNVQNTNVTPAGVEAFYEKTMLIDVWHAP